jgi:hypothetical protein
MLELGLFVVFCALAVTSLYGLVRARRNLQIATMSEDGFATHIPVGDLGVELPPEELQKVKSEGWADYWFESEGS